MTTLQAQTTLAESKRGTLLLRCMARQERTTYGVLRHLLRRTVHNIDYLHRIDTTNLRVMFCHYVLVLPYFFYISSFSSVSSFDDKYVTVYCVDASMLSRAEKYRSFHKPSAVITRELKRTRYSGRRKIQRWCPSRYVSPYLYALIYMFI